MKDMHSRSETFAFYVFEPSLYPERFGFGIWIGLTAHSRLGSEVFA